MGLRIKSGMNTKRIQNRLREWVQKRDRELLTLLIIYLTIILWILNFNI
jgi:hypothetical protein